MSCTLLYMYGAMRNILSAAVCVTDVLKIHYIHALRLQQCIMQQRCNRIPKICRFNNAIRTKYLGDLKCTVVQPRAFTTGGSAGVSKMIVSRLQRACCQDTFGDVDFRIFIE
jgi:hypothetical protein